MILFGHKRWTVRFCVSGQLLNLFCASGWQFCSTEVELFVLIESSYSVDFALQFGKAWNRSFVGRDIFAIHLFLIIIVWNFTIFRLNFRIPQEHFLL